MFDLAISESEIFAALRLLFATNGKSCREVLESIQESEIKSAYRKKALQTHPDMFASRGPNYQKLCSQRFIDVAKAYETLKAYVKARESRFNFTPDYVGRNGSSNFRHERQQSRSAQDFCKDKSNGDFIRSFRQRGLPLRPLRFGELLFYSGVIEWKELVGALLWQSRQRLRIGEIAQKWRWTSEPQIARVISTRAPGELLGQAMVNCRIINNFQLKVLLRQQKKNQKPIGQYFVEQRLVTQDQIIDTLRRQTAHNLSYSSN